MIDDEMEFILGTDYANHGKLDSRGQIPTVSGFDNLKQALKRAVETRIGTYYYLDSDYGNSAIDMLGESDNDINRELICFGIELCVLHDPRVETAHCEYVNGNYNLTGTIVTGEDFIIEEIM